MKTSTKQSQSTSDNFSVTPVNKRGTNQIHNEELLTIDFNDLFDGIMKSINQFTFDFAEQRLQEKNS